MDNHKQYKYKFEKLKLIINLESSERKMELEKSIYKRIFHDFTFAEEEKKKKRH